MEAEAALTSSQTQTSSTPPSPASPPPPSAPRYGTIIPNRIFVGGIDFKTNESDLRRFFSQFGPVKEVKIVSDRAGVSKGYGFVTFQTQEDAQKILQEADKVCFRDKRLNIGQAIRKQQMSFYHGGFPDTSPSVAPPAPGGTLYLTTPTGYPYTFHNGVAYFHSPEPSLTQNHWPPRSVSSSPVMVTHQAQPVFPQPSYHHYQASAQCVPGHWQWSLPQSAVPVGPTLYMQSSELMYCPLELPPPDGGCATPALPLLEATVPERDDGMLTACSPYLMPWQHLHDHAVQPAYHPVFAQGPPILQPDPCKEQRLPRRGFPPKPRSGRSPHHTHPRKEYGQEVAAPLLPAGADTFK
ncbi:protein boule-like [Amia ocellicauda]|uniref:protein boule-like n=1 Tax=Amia ocellicauda TaxID=2972642 RepID=UPI0034649B37